MPSDPLADWARTHGIHDDALRDLQRLLDAQAADVPAFSGVWSTLQLAPDPTAAPVDLPTGSDAHLTPLEPLGAGGMGEVLRAHDARLGRDVALKVLQPRHMGSQALRARFLAEAQAQAQLAHPGIVPVHEIGTLADGRPFFTMRINRGRDLHHVIQELHDTEHPDPEAALRRVVEVVRRATEVVAYAHSKGVLHRDLKPANVMVGAFGEVQVIDWGLVLADGTQADVVAGTPGYMPPEQAAGETVGPASDVFALGRILTDLLRDHAPQGLAEVVARATMPDPAARYPHAGALAQALSDWLDGAARRAKARQFLTEAAELQPEAERWTRQAEVHEAAAAALKVQIHPSAPLDEKADWWREQDEAARCRTLARTAQRTRVERLLQALSHDPDSPEATRQLAAWHRDQVVRAEARADHAAAQTAEARLRLYDRGEHTAFLQGTGTVTLVTEPAGASVGLFRLVEEQRRLTPVFERDLGRTPLTEVPLERGSWLLRIEAQRHQVVDYPVYIGRLEHWTGTAPDADTPHPVVLPTLGSLDPDDCYVPAGWFRFGDDRSRLQAWPAERRWLPAFVMRRFPVTNRDFIAFLDDLVARGETALAERYVPRAQRAQGDDRIEPVYARNDDGTHRLVPDGDGDLWDVDWPVVQVDWVAARAYAAWVAERTGQPWRLPREDEWEKAARGVDGRIYPWGDRFDSTFALVRTSFRGRPTLAPVQDFPLDCSVYGVRGMAGGVRDWCQERFARPGVPPPPEHTPGERLLRGGCWHFKAATAGTTVRARLYQERVSDLVGFRLVRPLVR
ncbi:MAG: SUMF1/EgtB/PvdO family nonheme iron enzyme [Myxococcales bacterium]|nr:SUMF1/EgtB/PvdO family nonheme iron enzyme [Myxococcales bacterium]